MSPTVVVCGLIHESNAFAGDVTPLDAFVRLGARQLAKLDDACEVLVAELVDGVVAATAERPVDGAVVCLHGSMCSVSDPDVDWSPA